MKKNWKALTAVCCAAVLTLSLTACSGSSGSNTGSDSSAGTAAAGTTGEEVSASSGRTDLNIHIGDAFSTVDPHNLSLNADMMLSRQITSLSTGSMTAQKKFPCWQRNIP